MDRTADLQLALKFVTGRIEEQAKCSGESLTDEQRFLLDNLPSSSVQLTMYGDREPPPLVPRDINYERLCALARIAHQNDLHLNPQLLDWEFASAVFKLNNHPMCSLLAWAGVKQPRPWWDRFLLIIAALLFVGAMMAIMLLVGTENRMAWVKFGSGYAVIVLLTYFGSRRMEQWELEKEIDRCRLASRFMSTTAA